MLLADPAWGLERAVFAVAGGDGRAPSLSLENGRHAVRFARTAAGQPEFAVAVKFGETDPFRLTFRPAAPSPLPRPGGDAELVLARVEALGSVIAFGEQPAPTKRLTARPVSPPAMSEGLGEILSGGWLRDESRR